MKVASSFVATRCRHSVTVSLQQPPSPQRPLKRGLHLHVLGLGDGEVEVLNGGVATSMSANSRR